MDDLEKLRAHKHLTVTKKGKEETGSVSFVVTENGNEYFAGSVASDTHLLDFTSEQVALSCAKNRNDLLVRKVVTLLGKENSQGFLLVALKIVSDYSTRTGKEISYDVFDSEGKKVFSTEDVQNSLPFYTPKVSPLMERLKCVPDRNVVGLIDPGKKEQELKHLAKLGVKRNLPTHDLASGYGVAVLLENNEIVFGGQYGSYDNRLGMHAEMSVVLDALMNNPGRKIADLALISTKYESEPCVVCGACLQFLSEISHRFGFEPVIHCFAFSTNASNRYTLQELLPKRWTSKNW